MTVNDFAKRNEQHRAALRDANAKNKTALFDALADEKVTHVEVEFDGEGDSGGITNVAAFRGDVSADLPNDKVHILSVSFGSKILTTPGEYPLEEAIETACYGYLEQVHDGWENNDGAYGTFRLDVAKRTIELEFNGRISDVATSTYEF